MTEAEYRQEHISMWEYVIEKIFELKKEYEHYQALERLGVKNRKKVFPESSFNFVDRVKSEYLLEFKRKLDTKLFFMHKINPYEVELFDNLQKGISHNCFACHFARQELKRCNSNQEPCSICPLVDNSGGLLETKCSSSRSCYYILGAELQNMNFITPLHMALNIKNAWRENLYMHECDRTVRNTDCRPVFKIDYYC